MENHAVVGHQIPRGEGGAPEESEVLVIGAGPVGLLLGNLLGGAGIGTTIFEKRTGRSPASRAISIMPPTLAILDRIGLRERVEAEAIRVPEARVHGRGGPLGTIDLDGIPAPFPAILSLPQSRTEAILEEGLARFSCVRLLRGREAADPVPEAERIELTVRRSDTADASGDADAQGENGGRIRFNGRFLCIADGSGGSIAASLGLRRRRVRHAEAFVMGDFRDRSAYGDSAHLWFIRGGSVESFPLPGGIRRWIIETDGFLPEPPPGFLEAEVAARTGTALRHGDRLWLSSFRTGTSILRRFAVERILVCGDAAHVIPPVGGQGMNLGFADADLAARMLEAILLRGADRKALFARYDRFRRRAAWLAAIRAWLAMKVGTVRWRPWDRLRDRFVAFVLGPPLAARLPAHFSMVTLPYGNSAQLVRGRRFPQLRRAWTIARKPPRRLRERKAANPSSENSSSSSPRSGK